MAKRAFDILFSLAVLAAALPILLLIALLIKLDSPGPVLFVTKRCGRYRNPFDFLKFRTMVADAERLGSRMLTVEGDPRITRVGHYLRAFKLDELPQFINVLRGEMSVVGPRPEVYDIVDRHYRDEWDEILEHQPGMTCLLQLAIYPDFSVMHQGIDDPHGHYLQYGLPLKIALDREYVRCASFWLDLTIVLRTAYCIAFKSWAHVARSAAGWSPHPRRSPERRDAPPPVNPGPV